MKSILLKALGAAVLGVCAAQAVGQAEEQATGEGTTDPYWASLRADEVYMRVGPSGSYPIEWVYHREGLPVKVLRVNEGWRYIEDHTGARGWMSQRMLMLNRGAIVTGEDDVAMHADADGASAVRWYLEPGVVGDLGECSEGWCELDVAGHVGWVPEDRLWGDGDP